MERVRKAAAIAAAACLMCMPAFAQRLVPGGQSIGVALKTGGAVVIGTSDVGAQPSPARKAGLRSGDVVTNVNGKDVTDAQQLGRLLTEGQNRIEYMRNGDMRTALVVPANDGGALKLGAWVRDSAAGVGTVTYYDPETGRYGALGHPVTDADAGIVLPVADGTIYENTIVGVEKGKNGEPGEILGQFYDGAALGDVDINSEFGIFGDTDGFLDEEVSGSIETAGRGEVHPGSAEIMTTVDGRGLGRFDCEIVRIESMSRETNRSFMLRVTDEELIDITGGIVQGMSGSPIIQDGKLVGAVTHVMVDDPTRGYGIFIENMLEAAL